LRLTVMTSGEPRDRHHARKFLFAVADNEEAMPNWSGVL
jgi:hypothetical protein